MSESDHLYPEAQRVKAMLQSKRDTELPALKGIPADASIEDRYQALEALGAETLAAIMLDETQPASAKVAAVKEANDRARGKAIAKVDIAVRSEAIYEIQDEIRQIRESRLPLIEAELITQESCDERQPIT